MIIRLKENNRFLPTRRNAKVSSSATVFAMPVGRSNLTYLNVVYFFDGVLYLNFVGPFVNFKAIRPFCIGEMHPLFRNQRPNYHIIIVKHLSLILTYLVSVQKSLKSLFRKQHLLTSANIARVQISNRYNRYLRNISR